MLLLACYITHNVQSSILFSVCQYVTLHNVHIIRAGGKGAAYGCKFMEYLVIYLYESINGQKVLVVLQDKLL